MSTNWLALEAVQAGDMVKMQHLIQENPKILDDHGSTVLLSAAEHGRADIVLKILAQKPNLLGSSTTSGWTLMHYAARHGQDELVQSLAALGPHLIYQPSHTMLRTPLHFAAEKGHEKVVRVLLDQLIKHKEAASKAQRGRRNFDIGGEPDALGLTPLHLAVRHRQEVVARVLLAHRPELIAAVDNSHNTVLHEAAANCGAQFVHELCDHHLEALFTLNHSLQTPLHRAVMCSNEPVLELLQWRFPFDDVMEAYLMCDKSYLPRLRVFMGLVEPALACLNDDVMRVVYSYIKLEKREVLAPHTHQFRHL